MISSAENKAVRATLQVKRRTRHPVVKNITWPLIDSQAIARDANGDLSIRTPPENGGERKKAYPEKHDQDDHPASGFPQRGQTRYITAANAASDA